MNRHVKRLTLDGKVKKIGIVVPPEATRQWAAMRMVDELAKLITFTEVDGRRIALSPAIITDED